MINNQISFTTEDTKELTKRYEEVSTKEERETVDRHVAEAEQTEKPTETISEAFVDAGVSELLMEENEAVSAGVFDVESKVSSAEADVLREVRTGEASEDLADSSPEQSVVGEPDEIPFEEAEAVSAGVFGGNIEKSDEPSASLSDAEEDLSDAEEDDIFFDDDEEVEETEETEETKETRETKEQVAFDFDTIDCDVCSHPFGAESVLSVVCTKKNGNRVTIARNVLEKIGVAGTVQVAYSKPMDALILGKNLGGVNYLLKKSHGKEIIYNKALVEYIKGVFHLNFNGVTTVSFYDVDYMEHVKAGKIAVIRKGGNA